MLRSVGLLGAAGVGLGLLGAYGVRPLLAAFLFGIGSFDALTYGGIGGLFLLISDVEVKVRIEGGAEAVMEADSAGLGIGGGTGSRAMEGGADGA